MKQILEKFTKVEIARRTGKGYTTVLGWFKRNSMPTGELDVLGFEITAKGKRVATDEEVRDAVIKRFGQPTPKNKIKRGK